MIEYWIILWYTSSQNKEKWTFIAIIKDDCNLKRKQWEDKWILECLWSENGCSIKNSMAPAAYLWLLLPLSSTCYHSMAASGISWRLLQLYGCCWHSMVPTTTLWLLLSLYGTICWVLYGCCYHFTAPAAILWMLLPLYGACCNLMTQYICIGLCNAWLLS